MYYIEQKLLTGRGTKNVREQKMMKIEQKISLIFFFSEIFFLAILALLGS